MTSGRQAEEPIRTLCSGAGTRNPLQRANGKSRRRTRPNRLLPGGRRWAKWAALSSQHVGGGGRGPTAAEASTPSPSTTFFSLRGGLGGAGRPGNAGWRAAGVGARSGSRGRAVEGAGEARAGYGGCERGQVSRGPPGLCGDGRRLRGACSRGLGRPPGPLSPGLLTTTFPRGPRLKRTRRRWPSRGRPRGMEERKEEGEAEIQEHGPEHWFSKWERQCLAEAEQDEQLSPELQEEAAAAAQPEHKQQKLWHLFQNSATAVAQLYKDRVCQQPGLSLWVPFQNAATAVTNLYKGTYDSV
ncbi:hypothetical protein HispidOSU_005251 [Sigmodon hispidus]